MQSTIPTPPVGRIIVVQLIITCIIAGLFLVIKDELSAVSALIGGMIYTVPNAYFIRKAWQYLGASRMAHTVSSFYKGETWKMFLSALLFAALFKSFPQADVVAVFLAFGAAMLMNICAPLYVRFL
jgi:ATP synthase protein I